MRRVHLLAALCALPAPLEAQFGSLAAVLGPVNSGAYGGHIHWTHTIRGQHGFTEEAVTVLITAGQAVCTGGLTTESGHQGIVGDALFEIEFLSWDAIIDDMLPPGADSVEYTGRQIEAFQDSLRRLHRNDAAYQWAVACPGPGRNSSTHPAHWSNRRTSYQQPGGPKLVNGQVVFPDTLRGTWSIPAPETDSVNGVSGMYSMTWLICKGCLPPSAYRNPP